MSHRLSSGTMLLATSSAATRRASCYSLGARVALRRGLYAPGRNPWPGRHGGSLGKLRKASSRMPSPNPPRTASRCCRLLPAHTRSPGHRLPRPSREPCLRPRSPRSRPRTPPQAHHLAPRENTSPLPCTPCTLPSALPSNPAAPAPHLLSIPSPARRKALPAALTPGCYGYAGPGRRAGRGGVAGARPCSRTPAGRTRLPW